MKVSTTIECHHGEHPIELDITPDGSIIMDPIPLIEDIFPCIKKFRLTCEKTNLVRLHCPDEVVLVKIIRAIVRCLRPDNTNGKIIIENDADLEILGNFFRHAQPEVVRTLIKDVQTINAEKHSEGIIQRVMDWKLGKEGFIKDFAYALIKEYEFPDNSFYTHTLILKLLENPETKEPTIEAFREAFAKVVEDRKRNPTRSIHTSFAYLWAQEIMVRQAEDVYKTIEFLLEILKIRRERQVNLGCYWALRHAAVIQSLKIVANPPNDWTDAEREELAKKVGKLLDLEKEILRQN